MLMLLQAGISVVDPTAVAGSVINILGSPWKLCFAPIVLEPRSSRGH
jgi:hypothetical protein